MSDIVKSKIIPTLFIAVNNSMNLRKGLGEAYLKGVYSFEQKVGKIIWGIGFSEGVGGFSSGVDILALNKYQHESL